VYKTSSAKEERIILCLRTEEQKKKKIEMKFLSVTAATGEEIIQNFVLYIRTYE
jgi:hypothetical protein